MAFRSKKIALPLFPVPPSVLKPGFWSTTAPSYLGDIVRKKWARFGRIRAAVLSSAVAVSRACIDGPGTSLNLDLFTLLLIFTDPSLTRHALTFVSGWGRSLEGTFQPVEIPYDCLTGWHIAFIQTLLSLLAGLCPT